MSAFLANLKVAVAAKNEKNGMPIREYVPHPVKYLASSGTYVASDGKPYAVVYEGESYE